LNSTKQTNDGSFANYQNIIILIPKPKLLLKILYKLLKGYILSCVKVNYICTNKKFLHKITS